MQYAIANLTIPCNRNCLDIFLTNRALVMSIHDIFILGFLTALVGVTNLFGRIFDDALSPTGDGT
jgi:hypothetical protein